MTTTTDPTGELAERVEQLRAGDPVVPEGVDPIDKLTVRELDIASRQLGADVWSCFADQGAGAGKRWGAMARIGWLWQKRTDPRAKLDPWLDLNADDLTRLLRMDTDPDPADDAGDDGTAEVTANPTVPALES